MEEEDTTTELDALSSFLNKPGRTVIRIEAFVAVAAILLLLQLILGSCRRRSGHWFVRGALWVAYTLSFPIITYTLGQMMSSPVKSGLYPIWAVILLLISGCTNSVTAYDLDDNSKWRRYLFELIQHSFYLVIIFQLLYATRSVIPEINGAYADVDRSPQRIGFPFLFLFGVAIFDNLTRVIAGRMVTNSSSSKVLADYMRDQVDARGAQDSFDPATMKGYKYIVYQAEGSGTNRAAYRTQVRADALITIETIWDMDFGDTARGGSRLKDACLSFALSHLLKRRFFGMECSEAAFPETRRFVLEGLLSGEESDGVPSYRRAFHIVEVELGFLYDFFFTKYGVLFRMEKPFLVMAVVKLVLICICELFLLYDPPVVMTLDPVIEVSTREVDVTVTAVVMGTLLLVQVLQAISYLTSDWATVSLACSYPLKTSDKCVPCIIWFLGIFNLSRLRKSRRFLGALNLFGYGQTKMGQSSVIEGCLQANLSSVLHSPINCILNLLFSTTLTTKAFKPVPDLVKSEIVSCLQVVSRIGGPVTNGEAALERNGVIGELSWALVNRNQTTTMLIWHIATEYCNTASFKKEEKEEEEKEEEEEKQEEEEQEEEEQQQEELQTDNYQKVAVTLSRYCAYLMSFVPDLLPGSSTDTVFVFSCVQWEVREMLRGRKPSRDRLLKVVTDSRGRIRDTIFVKGLKLGSELEEKIQDDVLRWKVLAEFWAETIIYIAPSENVKAHMERLAQGGEFLTHVWALLNHAGILEPEPKLTPEEIV